VDEQLGMLVLGDLARVLDCLSLRIVDGGRAAVARTANGPTVLVRHDMLVLLGHLEAPFTRLPNVPLD
jgi:hypothetical protein